MSNNKTLILLLLILVILYILVNNTSLIRLKQGSWNQINGWKGYI